MPPLQQYLFVGSNFMRHLIIIATLFIFISCKKDKIDKPIFDGVNCSGNCFILRGSVTDTPSNQRLSNVEVRFYLGQVTNGQFPPPPDKLYLGKTLTNNNGEYEFKFDGTNFKYGSPLYYIEASKTGYIFGPRPEQQKIKLFYLDSSNFNNPLVQNFNLFRPTTLRVRFRATNITNFNFIAFGYSYGGGLGGGINIDGRRQIDTTVNFITGNNVQTFIGYGAYGNGVTIERRDTLIINSSTVTDYQVNF